jgi:hypothetical protein
MTPKAKAELSKWLHGAILAAGYGAVDALTAGQATGAIALKTVAVAVAVRVVGYVVSRWGPRP